ncbi:MAG: TIGR00282 family metallophosphoesterase [Alphaproteobacteria bacterium]|nr:TIGR00282 family metallophosphoesterase [Alphaproteobacteria bacterium]MBO7097129.1 TIGR00282 family metallophosphoesterase [Alphaproteobacteria bacterium]
MKILYCGDVVGRPGRDAVLKHIQNIKKQYQADAVIVNAENAAHGFGLTPGICRDFFEVGVDLITTGNHVFDQRDILPFLDSDKRIIRPLNYPAGTIGRGFTVLELANGKKLMVAQVMGRVFMEALDCPVKALEEVLSKHSLQHGADAILVDIHAEASSEKISFAHYFDGRVSAVIGTHTHVPTADECILKNGTAYLTDVGMCGDYQSVLGFEEATPIARLLRKYPTDRLIPSKGAGTLAAVFIETSDETGLAQKIERIFLKP